ncbi:tetratricopeptide repeat protein [Adlercreutzia caecimuris]|uniref:tetratricopeptide repeat protein n=1 Tax=Adlercreutzia caecimuris TaxID=671266 RepID=UPI001C3E959A|nr:hypothetical protein [Adlercreutzia caecimuris]
MGEFSIGIALFVLIIVVGLVIGLRLSSTSPQRRAVAAAFASMALVAALFWVVAINASQVWSAPFFAIACIVVPIAAYMGVMKAAKAAQAARRREEPTLRARTTEPRTRTVKPGVGVDGALMPVTPNHPVNEFRSLQRPCPPVEDYELEDEELPTVEEGAQEEDDSAEVVEAARNENVECADGPDVAEPSDATGPDPKAEAFIEDYLIEQNEVDDGIFEPEVAPSLKPPQGPSHSTSTMMLTVPFAEGDERYLVVSDTETVPNPILAYKRTTSSHLVPLGSPRRGAHAKPAPEPDVEAASVAPAIPEAVAAPEAEAEETFKLRKTVLDPNATGEVDFSAIFGTAEEPASGDDSQLALDFTAARAFTPAAPVKTKAVPSSVSQAPAAPVAASVPTASPAPAVSAPEPTPAPAPEPAPEPTPAPASAPAFAVASAAPESAAPIAGVPAPAPAAQPQIAPQPAPAPQPAIAPTAPEPVPAAELAPAVAPEPAPLSAPGIEVPADFVPAAPAPASTREARFEEFLAKAQGLRDKGLYPVAARLYGEAAAAAPQDSDARRARFEEMACYVKAGQGDKARALAAELRTSSVLTRVERIKLDAVERMG